MREFAMLKQVFQRNASLPERVTIPPGDDMGAVRVDRGELLVTVDQVIDGVHVRVNVDGLEAAGRKVVLRNLSDVAAMAAVPVGAVVACALPREMTESEALVLFESMASSAEAYACPLVGGDISVHEGRLCVSMTVFAETAGIAPVRRNGAQVGDHIWVTGRLGGAWDEQGGGPHLQQEPRLAWARRVASDMATRPSAMIDLSDGLAGDMLRICEQSGIAARIDVDRLPCRPEAMNRANQSGHPAWHHALTDGEDYELCFTAKPDKADALRGLGDQIFLTRVGKIEAMADDRPAVRFFEHNNLVTLEASAWEHRA